MDNNNIVQRRHPSQWIFLRHLKDEQRLVESTTAAAERGEPRPRPKKKWRDLEDRIVRLKREYSLMTACVTSMNIGMRCSILYTTLSSEDSQIPFFPSIERHISAAM